MPTDKQLNGDYPGLQRMRNACAYLGNRKRIKLFLID